VATIDNMKEGLKIETKVGNILYETSWNVGVDYNTTTKIEEEKMVQKMTI
jgi:hypothetical protein